MKVVTQKAHREIRIKWVRSGIGFSYRAKEAIRSLGLHRLNHVVECPDTPQVRGLLAKVPHLVEVVSDVSRQAWLSVPEYTILPAEAAAEVASRRKRRPAGEALSEEKGEVEVLKPVAQRAAKAEASKKATAPKKRARAAEERKGKAAAKAGETKKKEKAASPRGGAKSAGKKKK